MKIEILTTDKKHPINPYLRQLMSNLRNEHSISIVRSPQEVGKGDLLFLISCNEKVSSNIIKKFQHVMVIHASDLPKGRGWSPHIWEIIGGAREITVSLLDASDAIDCGDIYKKISIEIPSSALWNEINDILFSAEMQLIEFAVENFSHLKKTAQRKDIEATYYKKRTPEDSKIDPFKPLSDQFNLIRVCDPDRFPAFFELEGATYNLVLKKV